MSDETNTGSDGSRRSSSIDLPKSAVTDLTPKVAGAEGAAPKAEASSSKAEAPSRGGRDPESAGKTVPVVGGAVAGAIFGLLGAVGYQNLAAPPVTVADPEVRKVRDEMGLVRQQVVDTRGIEQRLTSTFEQKMAALSAQSQKDFEARTAALEQRAQAAEQRAAAAEQKGALAEQRAAAAEQKAATLIAPVDDRLKAAEARVAEGRDLTTTLNKRVDLLAQIEPPKVDLRPIITKVDELERAIGSNTARALLNGDAASALDARIKAVEQSAGALGQSVQGVDQGLKTLGTAVADLKAQPRPVDVPAALVATAGLARRAIDGGEPLGAVVSAFTGLGVAPAQVQPLAVFASKAAPPAAVLADQYAALAASLQKAAPAAAAAPQDDGVLARVKSSLFSQVEVRPVGAIAVDPTGIAPKVRALLMAGDSAAALALVATLPADQQTALKPFVEAVRARAAAYESVRKIETDALAATARKG